MSLLLKNLTWFEKDKKHSIDMDVPSGSPKNIKSIFGRSSQIAIDLGDCYAYRGLFNAHDHLEMNLYPKLGHPPYQNYVEWAKDIYKPKQSPLLEIERVDIKDRLLWGGLKNLIAGVTTVAHHNPWNSFFENKNFPINVVKQMTWAHSLSLGKNIENDYKNEKPFVIHAAEGIDDLAAGEISQLNSLGLLQKNTVLVHAVGVTNEDSELIKRNGSSVIWCPASNLFMFNETAPIENLMNNVSLALGSDSTLTGSSTFLDEMKQALETNLVGKKELYEMVSESARAIFRMKEQSLETGDFFVTTKKVDDYLENLMLIHPRDIQLVFVKGKVRLLDSALLKLKELKHSFSIGGASKQTDINVAALKNRIKKIVGEKILEKNPLWQLIEA
jgi:cytosine/adenosine deaminase-related metal-dependent hydrolase